MFIKSSATTRYPDNISGVFKNIYNNDKKRRWVDIMFEMNYSSL
ncbi:hypothetical protein ECL_04008 [Enterobacter cloacae subsp. cloacae ATCC 13047]|uniref:Uncharacterized protein n=1 Tax=Enterobacter cloacae subsp. cloacae (strain ATCC 13047 / DSM 30054 / NBRC 13535 / NCTC 10005 / WDCM 00083 / NCDC 279-56) TaxID=716541 RepID=A0A0H3CSM2_ENTCC|nr:hypothetical protein ECL_04008 [Enterobacter cloacae subsp. cloacae ATCC 13047]